MANTSTRYTPKTGYHRAQELIAECIAAKATTLDLGNLALEEIPPELEECVWLERLNFGDSFYQDKETGKWLSGQGDKSRSNDNTISILPAFVQEFKRLRILALNKTLITDLSPVVGLTSLTHLNLWSTDIEDIAPLASLTLLTSLDLRATGVTDLSLLAGLTALTNLQLVMSDVTDLTPLAGLTLLANLDFSHTEVADLAPIAGLTLLANLDFSHTEVADLAPIADLKLLTKLDLSGTSISNLAPLVGLTSLTGLNLTNTRVTDLTPLAGLTALTHLNFWNADIEDITPLANLKSLRSLDFSYTKVANLAPLASLTLLDYLSCKCTQIRDLSPLSGLNLLTYLSLNRSSQVTDLAPLSGLTLLTALDLYHTQVADVAPLAGLTSLTFLGLSATQITNVAPLAGLTALTGLYLSRTQIKDVAPLADLTMLTDLDLSSTLVANVSSLADLKSLRFLGMGNSKVEDLSPLASLVALDFLDLSNTKIKDVTPLVGLTSLAYLNLSNTQVEDIAALVALTSLTSLDLNRTPCLKYPPEIFSKEWNSYRNLVAWEADKAEGTHPNHLFKLIICGNGTVGKTKIVKRIETGAYQEEGESTEGVQIYLTEEKVFSEGHKKVRLAIWDFAGQEVYYQLHRLFFRNRAVYLVVFDKKTWDERFQADPKNGRKDENRAIDYWLSDIAASAGDAQIILVQNKVDINGPIDVSQRLPEKFKGLPLIRISAKSGLRFNELLSAIHEAIDRLPRSGMELPQSWWAVREAILEIQQDKADTRQLLSKDEFMAICKEKDLCANSEDALLAYLDGIGVVLYDRYLFPGQVVVNQQWALDAIYTVLERVVDPAANDWRRRAIMEFQKECAGENGLFLEKDLPFGDKYSAKERKLFLKIMVRAGICFETNAKKKDEPLYLMFQHLRADRPLSVTTTWSASSAGGCRALRYVFPYHLHKGIFRELMRGLFPKVSLQNIWQEGLLLPWNNALALVSVNYRGKGSYLEIKCAGTSKEANQLLSAFRNLMTKQLDQTGEHILQVSNDETDWFTYGAIQEAEEGEAKTSRTVSGEMRGNWSELRWCLRMDKEANFSDVPEERHQE